jgi:voltage-gated potassium channel
MAVFVLLREFISSLVRKLSWAGLGLILLAHALIAYIGLWLAGEKHLLEPATFIYFYVTTTSTVGYGDMAPQSAGGRIFDAIWLILGGIALITAAIGKVTNLVIELWRKRMKGRGDFSTRVGHTVLVGWRGSESEKVIRLLQQDDATNGDRIVLVDCDCEENPAPGKVDFIRGDTLSSEALMDRAGACGAARILVHAPSDDQTLAVVLTINSLDTIAHVVAHFQSSESANLARKYAPSLECTSSMSTEMLVRSAQDPGSSLVINELLCVGEGATQYTCRLPAEYVTSFGSLYRRLKEEHNAVLIGYRKNLAVSPQINPSSEVRVEGGELFYIADKRLPEGYFT